MGTDSFIILLIVLGIAAVPLILLVLMAKLLGRQEQNHEDLAARLRGIEREVKKTRDLVQDMTDKQMPPAPLPTPSIQPLKAVEPKKPVVAEPVLAETVEPIPAAPPMSPAVTRFVETMAAADATSNEPPAPHHEEEPAPTPLVFPPRETPATPYEPSRFELAAKEILEKIWNWIIVGEEHVPEGVSFEYAFASNWLLRIGALIIVMGVGFFLSWSIERNLINETARVLLSAMAGLGAIIAGTQMLGRRYHLFGQGLIGAGIATLYLSVYAAANFYHLVSVPAAFGLMIAVTCLAAWIAVRFDSLLVAILGILGGYGTPIMLSTGVVNFVGLYSYLLILGIGVFAISSRKNWHLLNYLSFFGTYALFFLAMQKYEAVNFWQVMPFLIAFFCLFSTMTFIHNLVYRKKSNLLDVLTLWINAGVFFAVSYGLIREVYGQKAVAIASLGLAAFYAAHVYYFLLRRVLDRELLLSFTALSAFFLAVTMPLVLSSQWITASWAIQALVMLWVAGKLESEFLRHVAYLLYVIVLGRFAGIDLPADYLHAHAMDVPMTVYLWAMVERLVSLGVPVASVGGAAWLLRVSPAKARSTVGRENDIPAWLPIDKAVWTTVAVALAMLFVGLHLELNRSMAYFFPPMRLPMLSLLWVAMCVFLLREYRIRSSSPLLTLLALFVAGMAIKLFFFDLTSWNVTEAMRYAGAGYSFLDGTMRLLDFGVIIVFLVFACRLLPLDSEETRILSRVFGVAAVSLLFVFLTLEVNTFLHHFVPGLRAGGISILWSMFALSFISAGIWKDARWVRYAGLALFAIVAGKVLFSDLARLDQVYRIVAFILLGILVLSGSFLYLKHRPARLDAEDRENQK